MHIAFLTVISTAIMDVSKDSYGDRYSRIIKVVGERLKKIKHSSVLVVGAGGLGSAVVAYLAGVGVGKLGIADGDKVEVHNLDRQMVHAGKIGMNKAESTKLFVEKLNPDVEVVTFGNLGKEDEKIVREFDVVVSCVDTFASRFTLNELCVREKKPMVHGAIAGFEGELMVFLPDGPCYRCIYSGDYEERDFPVLPPVAGAVGCMQAVETIKLLCGYEVTKELVRIDFRYMEMLKVRVEKKEDCPVCSKQ